MSHVFSRAIGRTLPVVDRAEGALIWDADGRRYIDGAGGAIVVGIGHGRTEVADAVARQAGRVAYAHGTAFTSEPLERYASELAPLLPMDGARVYPVSGGSEAVETALKLARAYHLASGEPSRTLVIGRRSSYHGNTLGALDASGREPLRRPYEPWLGRAVARAARIRVPVPAPEHPDGCGGALADQLDGPSRRRGPRRSRASSPSRWPARPSAPPFRSDDYWPAIREVCDRHGVLLIADEVMTGFGRTGTWFGCDHWDLRPDILTAGKGTSSGYWPLGLGGRERRRVRDRRRVGVHARVHVLALGRRRGRRAGRPGDPARRAPGRREPRQGRAAAQGAHRRGRRPSARGRHPRARPDGRRRAGRRPRHEASVPPLGRRRGARARGREGARAAALFVDRLRRTAPTATWSCSARRS